MSSTKKDALDSLTQLTGLTKRLAQDPISEMVAEEHRDTIQTYIHASKVESDEISSGGDFDTGIPELDQLLQEVYWLGEGRCTHESGFLFMSALDKVKDLIGERDKMIDFHAIRARLCQIGTVGKKDGYDLIRRESVIEMVDRMRPTETSTKEQS